jgi:hypothetical protein
MPSQRGDVCGEAAKVKLDRNVVRQLTGEYKSLDNQ